MHTARDVFTAVCAKIKCGVSTCKQCTEFFESREKCPYEDVSYEEMSAFMSNMYERLICFYDFKEEDIFDVFSRELEKPQR